MTTILIELLKNHPEHLYLISGTVLLFTFLNYLTKHNQLLKGILKMDYGRKIQKLDATREYLGRKDQKQKDAIGHEIEGLIFTNFTGYRWSKNRRTDFLRLYAFLQNDWNLESIKLLFLNSTVEDNTLSVKITKSSRLQLIVQFIFAIIMLYAFSVMFYTSFVITRNVLSGKIIFATLAFGFFFAGIYHLVDAIKKRSDLKSMKIKYDGAKIK